MNKKKGRPASPFTTAALALEVGDLIQAPDAKSAHAARATAKLRGITLQTRKVGKSYVVTRTA